MQSWRFPLFVRDRHFDHNAWWFRKLIWRNVFLHPCLFVFLHRVSNSFCQCGSLFHFDLQCHSPTMRGTKQISKSEWNRNQKELFNISRDEFLSRFSKGPNVMETQWLEVLAMIITLTTELSRFTIIFLHIKTLSQIFNERPRCQKWCQCVYLLRQ